MPARTAQKRCAEKAPPTTATVAPAGLNKHSQAIAAAASSSLQGNKIDVQPQRSGRVSMHAASEKAKRPRKGNESSRSRSEQPATDDLLAATPAAGNHSVAAVPVAAVRGGGTPTRSRARPTGFLSPQSAIARKIKQDIPSHGPAGKALDWSTTAATAGSSGAVLTVSLGLNEAGHIDPLAGLQGSGQGWLLSDAAIQAALAGDVKLSQALAQHCPATSTKRRKLLDGAYTTLQTAVQQVELAAAPLPLAASSSSAEPVAVGATLFSSVGAAAASEMFLSPKRRVRRMALKGHSLSTGATPAPPSHPGMPELAASYGGGSVAGLAALVESWKCCAGLPLRATAILDRLRRGYWALVDPCRVMQGGSLGDVSSSGSGAAADVCQDWVAHPAFHPLRLVSREIPAAIALLSMMELPASDAVGGPLDADVSAPLHRFCSSGISLDAGQLPVPSSATLSSAWMPASSGLGTHTTHVSAEDVSTHVTRKHGSAGRHTHVSQAELGGVPTRSASKRSTPRRNGNSLSSSSADVAAAVPAVSLPSSARKTPRASTLVSSPAAASLLTLDPYSSTPSRPSHAAESTSYASPTGAASSWAAAAAVTTPGAQSRGVTTRQAAMHTAQLELQRYVACALNWQRVGTSQGLSLWWPSDSARSNPAGCSAEGGASSVAAGKDLPTGTQLESASLEPGRFGLRAATALVAAFVEEVLLLPPEQLGEVPWHRRRPVAASAASSSSAAAELVGTSRATTMADAAPRASASSSSSSSSSSASGIGGSSSAPAFPPVPVPSAALISASRVGTKRRRRQPGALPDHILRRNRPQPPPPSSSAVTQVATLVEEDADGGRTAGGTDSRDPSPSLAASPSRGSPSAIHRATAAPSAVMMMSAGPPPPAALGVLRPHVKVRARSLQILLRLYLVGSRHGSAAAAASGAEAAEPAAAASSSSASFSSSSSSRAASSTPRAGAAKLNCDAAVGAPELRVLRTLVSELHFLLESFKSSEVNGLSFMLGRSGSSAAIDSWLTTLALLPFGARLPRTVAFLYRACESAPPAVLAAGAPSATEVAILNEDDSPPATAPLTAGASASSSSSSASALRLSSPPRVSRIRSGGVPDAQRGPAARGRAAAPSLASLAVEEESGGELGAGSLLRTSSVSWGLQGDISSASWAQGSSGSRHHGSASAAAQEQEYPRLALGPVAAGIPLSSGEGGGFGDGLGASAPAPTAFSTRGSVSIPLFEGPGSHGARPYSSAAAPGIGSQPPTTALPQPAGLDRGGASAASLESSLPSVPAPTGPRPPPPQRRRTFGLAGLASVSSLPAFPAASATVPVAAGPGSADPATAPTGAVGAPAPAASGSGAPLPLQSSSASSQRPIASGMAMPSSAPEGGGGTLPSHEVPGRRGGAAPPSNPFGAAAAASSSRAPPSTKPTAEQQRSSAVRALLSVPSNVSRGLKVGGGAPTAGGRPSARGSSSSAGGRSSAAPAASALFSASGAQGTASNSAPEALAGFPLSQLSQRDGWERGSQGVDIVDGFLGSEPSSRRDRDSRPPEHSSSSSSSHSNRGGSGGAGARAAGGAPQPAAAGSREAEDELLSRRRPDLHSSSFRQKTGMDRLLRGTVVEAPVRKDLLMQPKAARK